ncbi:DUF6053 domain-containing protein [Lysobacter enzymogenes]|uniref:DUF6053 domain-containing protein n=1 Tax=Lysobacter enzymogenes TaxID=69 RepID=UPI003D188D04
MGGPSGPMLLFQVAAIGSESIGPEGPPTTADPKASGSPEGPPQATPGARAPLQSAPCARPTCNACSSPAC